MNTPIFVKQAEKLNFPANGNQIEHAEKLRLLKGMLRKVSKNDKHVEALEMIDVIQRLGVDHHFRHEIREILHKQYTSLNRYSFGDDDLHQVSLRFRLLRQEGYFVPTSVFIKFEGKDKKIREILNDDVKGLMGLYEASQLSIKGEDILEEAREFSALHLNAWIPNLTPHEATIVRNTLDNPHHKSLSRFMVTKFDTTFRGTNNWMEDLQQLVKLDFEMDKTLHQNEIVEVLKWWGQLGLSKELEFARNQPLKWYIWSMASLTDPVLFEQRIDLTKPISLIYIIDDIFDVYGTLDELTLFTKVVDRWDYDMTKQLPHYMQVCFNALDEVTNEISFKIFMKHGWDPVNSLRKSWGNLMKAFLVEAKWFNMGELPTSEDYLKNGIISSGVIVILNHMFFLLGEGLNEETIELIEKTPDRGLISSVATVLRLWDDLGSAKDENQNGHDGSFLEYYMDEHPGSTVDDARNRVMGMISDAWKQINEECIGSNMFPEKFTKGCINAARMVPLMYNYDDNHDLPTLKNYLKSLINLI